MVEGEWYAAYARLAEIVGDETSPDAYLRMEQAAIAKGVVGVVELEYGEPFGAWPDRLGQGVDLLRVRRSVYPDGLDDAIASGLGWGDPLVEGQDLLTMGPLKIISDGSLNTRTAWCEKPYADGRAAVLPTRLPRSCARCSVERPSTACGPPSTRSVTPPATTRWRRTPRQVRRVRSSTPS